MNDFVNAAATPHFDSAAIAHRARRKRATAIAGVATALVVAGAGTALAAGAAGSGTHSARSAAAATATGKSTTVLYGSRNGTTVVRLAGVNSVGARTALVRLGLTPSFSRTPVAGCKQSTVVAVAPHAPTIVHAGETIHVTVCAG